MTLSFRSACVYFLAVSFASLSAQPTFEPTCIKDIVAIVKKAADEQSHITIKGADKGVSGKITLYKSLVLDLKHLNKILNLNLAEKTITVQAGITWKEIQECINPHGLSVAAMQSYHDFSVGGSISVNAHGQDFVFCPVGNTTKSMLIINAQGEFVRLSPQENAQLFHAVIGGYGLFGIIIEVTLQLTDNTILQKEVKLLSTKAGLAYSIKSLLTHNDIALYSARLTISPLTFFDKMLLITYKDTSGIGTEPLKPLPFLQTTLLQSAFSLLRKNDLFKGMRLFIEKNFIEQETTISRNAAMYYTIDHLKDSDETKIDILQEYFIPLDKIETFINTIKTILKKNQVNVLNGTIRFVKKDSSSFLNYAQQDVAALVLFISLDNNQDALTIAQQWTQELITAALAYKGTFYLPYQCWSTKEQIRRAYPQFDEFIELKKQYDPQEIFINDLYLHYR